MFPFGSLLTQVPLIIIGALYMLYLGVYAVNKSKEISSVADSGVKEQFVRGDSAEDPGIYYLINGFPDDKNDAVEGKTPFIETLASDFDSAVFFPEPEIFSHFCAYHLFSRPPPVILHRGFTGSHF